MPEHHSHPWEAEGPARLYVESSTYCNLSCAMCVREAPGARIAQRNMDYADFTRLEPVLRGAERLILNGIGEPLMHPELEALIAFAREHMPEGASIGFQSNGLMLGRERARSLLEAGMNRICVSIDALDPQVLARLRSGACVDDIDAALRAMSDARQATGRTCEVGVEFVLMRDNALELEAAVRWAAGAGVDFVLVTQVLAYALETLDQAAYVPSSPEALELLERWRIRAREQGVDLDRYPDIAMRFIKSPEDRQVFDLVQQMKAEAASQGMVLDVGALMALETDWLADIQAALERAQSAADELGVALHLPSLYLQERRRCDFVEEGSLFVSVEGEVHPCYFLWHHYDCHASGWEQPVRPWSFGNIVDRDPLDIWQGADFRQFRRNVVQYDYARCASCALAPCDYVQTEEFEQDCHIRTEPCGSCLWCMGIYQCLR